MAGVYENCIIREAAYKKIFPHDKAAFIVVAKNAKPGKHPVLIKWWHEGASVSCLIIYFYKLPIVDNEMDCPQLNALSFIKWAVSDQAACQWLSELLVLKTVRRFKTFSTNSQSFQLSRMTLKI